MIEEVYKAMSYGEKLEYEDVSALEEIVKKLEQSLNIICKEQLPYYLKLIKDTKRFSVRPYERYVVDAMVRNLRVDLELLRHSAYLIDKNIQNILKDFKNENSVKS